MGPGLVERGSTYQLQPDALVGGEGERDTSSQSQIRQVHTASERAASITDVPLTHKQQKSVFTKCFNHVRDYKTAVKNGRVLQPYSYIERKTRAATRSTVPYGGY
jgi:hypothetical protein